MSIAHTNIWTRNAEYLESAYLPVIDEQTSKLIVFGLLSHLEETNCSIVDIGGGGGLQSISLAQIGHAVTIVDIDPLMLQASEQRFEKLDADVRKRFNLVEGTAKDLVGIDRYDVVCCHSVIMYEDNWTALIRDLASLLRPQGLLSMTCLNPEASAMRLGRQRRWREVIATITTGLQCDPSCIPSNNISRAVLQAELKVIGVEPVAWYGVGVFEDGSSEESFAAEWLAGSTEPYRSVARTYHLIGRYVGS
jgi:S-adenosylmethionine-dependent methyltransferase